MRALSIFALFFAAASLQPAIATTLTPPDAGYSAMRIVNAAGTEISGKVYSDSGNERWETVMQGMRRISILRFNESKILLYMPDMKMAMELGRDQAGGFGLDRLFDGVDAEEAGNETIEGEKTTRYRVAPNEDNGNADMMVWLTPDGIPIRAEGKSKGGPFTMVLKDLERGEQDPSLFRLPDGVTPIAMPAGMPAMMGGAFSGMPQ
ncbi:MAG: hypothetical protein CVT73_13130 [Alphaproteobacteria bacterium HGW-Alphaproteobacteria-12]|nr:MAG: hypothetical protein CVT73_13130 [Alphaproteobacteria bacterium HGW-Alphaproteobacteria-12]